MIVKSIRLRNFRLIEDSTLVPERDGITGLVGDNGAGKSSFLIGLRWALHGVRPTGETNAKLIRQQSLNDNNFECFVDVTVEHGGRDLRVVRSMTKRGTVSARSWIDGSEMSVDSAGAVQRVVNEFLGMSEPVFAVKYVIGQGELSALLDSRPAGRRQIIEESVGVNILSKSIDHARKELSSMAKAPDYSDLITSLESQLSEVELLLGEARKGLAEVEGLGVEDVNVLRGEVTALDEAFAAWQRSSARVEALREQLEGLPSERVPVPDVVDDDGGLSERIARAEAVAREINMLREQLEGLPNERVDDTAVAGRVNRGSEYVAERVALIASVEGELNELSKFDASDINSVCALCAQPVSDVSHARHVFDERVAGLRERLSALRGELSRGRELLSNVRGELDSARHHNSLVERFESLSERLAGLGEPEDVEGLRTAHRQHVERVRESQEERALALAHNAKADQRDSIKQTLDSMDMPAKPDMGRKDELLSRIENAVRTDECIRSAQSLVREREKTYEATLAHLEDARKKQEQSNKVNAEREILAGSVEVLREYRENMLAMIGPEMESRMSELVNTMTRGEYPSVRVDEDFNVFVTSASGDERPVTSLSGGERAIVSLAMRMSLSGEDSGLLWMDEVSSALDSDRLDLFMSGLHELGRQIVIVDHRETSAQHYDRVVRFERGSESSRIVV